MTPKASRSHLSTEVLLDLLDDRLPGTRRQEAERHLGLPCADCRERLRALGAVIERMRSDRMEGVPEALRLRALAVFPGVAEPRPAASAAARLLALAFDSLTQPLPAATRRAVGEARRLRFSDAELVLELECETESSDQFTMRGRIENAGDEPWRIEVAAGDERSEQWTDGGGAFVFEGLPRGSVRVAVRGPSRRFETPDFEA